MRNSKFGLKAFGLVIMAALGLMAFTAVAAQAENLSGGGVAGKFKVLGSESLLAKATGLQENVGILLVPARNLEIRCAGGHLREGSEIINGNEGLVVLEFLECLSFVHTTGEHMGNCIIEDVPGSGDRVILATARLLPKLHEGQLYVLAEVDSPSSTVFAFIKYKSGTGCVLPLSNEVKGSVVGQLTDANAGAEAVQHLVTFSEAIQKLFQSGGVGDKLTFGAFESYINGSATVELTGVHTGCTFSVV